MKLGFLTACLPQASLREIAGWASGQGFEALEVAVWPALGDRPFTATHLDVERFTEREAEDVRALMAESNLTVSSLAFYDNNLHPDPGERDAVNAHVHRAIDAAALLGCPTVGTFVGRHPGRTVAENLVDAARVFAPLVDHAGEKGVKLVIENCVMEGWHPDGYPGNLAYSPELWEWMFSLGLYLNYDPSHLVWMGIDPVEGCARTSARSRTPRPRTSRSSPSGGTATASPARRSPGRTPGTSAGGAIGCPDSGRSTGGRWSTPSTRAGSRECCPWSTRTRSGVAPRTGSERVCRSPTGPFDPYWFTDDWSDRR